MIIDFHTHILEPSWVSERWWSWLTAYYRSQRRDSLTPNSDTASIIERFCDREGNKLLAAMDDAKIDRSVVLPLDWGLLLGEPPVSIEEQHKRIAEICQRSNGKIVPFVGIDPRRKNAIELIKLCLKDYKMQGIKLYPATGYALQNDEFRPIFETASEYNIPVLLHTGYSFGPFLSKYCEPAVLDYLCATHPNVTFIAAHLDAGYLEQLCWLGYAKPNLHADCSLMQIRTRQNYPEFSKSLRLACDLFGSRRILFGTDWPFSQSVMCHVDYLNAFRKLTSINHAGPKFAGYEIKQILGKNAEDLLTKKKGGI